MSTGQVSDNVLEIEIDGTTGLVSSEQHTEFDGTYRTRDVKSKCADFWDIEKIEF